jgi:hypothetical protein
VRLRYRRGVLPVARCERDRIVELGACWIRLLVSALLSSGNIQKTLEPFRSVREVAAFAVEAMDVLSGLNG